jgi:predicted secreted hydrolase
MGVSGVFWLSGCPRTEVPSEPIDVSALLAEEPDGFPREDSEKSYVFPQDHGPHLDHHMETWAFNGYLTTKTGRQFGFQLGILRVRLVPGNPQHKSAWATTEIYRGHLAITDIARQRFLSYERLSRAALGLSGAQSLPLRVWVEDWAIERVPDGNEDAVFRLRATEGDLQVDLSLISEKPPIRLHNGVLFARAARPPFAAYFLTRLVTEGVLKVGVRSYAVEGVSWLDRIWGEVPLPIGPSVWNRFLLQLEDGSEILVFQLRRRNGSSNPIITGLVIHTDGSTENLGRTQVGLKVLNHWLSSKDGTRYPVRWQLTIPEKRVELVVKPEVADQELNVSMRYWAGIVTLSGTVKGQPVSGHGYMELTGYTEEIANF